MSSTSLKLQHPFSYYSPATSRNSHCEYPSQGSPHIPKMQVSGLSDWRQPWTHTSCSSIPTYLCSSPKRSCSQRWATTLAATKEPPTAWLQTQTTPIGAEQAQKQLTGWRCSWQKSSSSCVLTKTTFEPPAATFKEFGSQSGDVLLSHRKVELKGFFRIYTTHWCWAGCRSLTQVTPIHFSLLTGRRKEGKRSPA